MTRNPDFDELVGSEPTGGEREQLRRVHELLVHAGPPPELTPRLQQPPARDAESNVRVLARRPVTRRVVLLPAAAIAVAAIFGGGYAAGHRGGTSAVARTLSLRGTAQAPGASATLEVQPAQGGNWPMTLYVSGLPKLAAPSYYVVYLVRNGRPWAPCGTFVVQKPSSRLALTLNAPYQLRRGDTWIVTRQIYGQTGTGPTVLRPA